jgi:hypothetical protein
MVNEALSSSADGGGAKEKGGAIARPAPYSSKVSS